MQQVDNRVGRVLSGRYELTARVSQELLGNVYAASDLERGRKVQVKILHEHLGRDDPRFGRFLREVRASSMVRHENTIEMLDSGTDDDLHYVVLEYFEARSLEEELEKGPLSVQRVAHIAAQIASAIGAAHQESVTHRALSPRNVLLLTDSPRGDFVKVRDFGLSKLERFNDDEESNHLTEAGMRVGNTAYMAPEYIERDRFHPKGDLYALGCLMMTMLTGKPPFVGRGASVLTDHVTTPPPRPSERREDVPGWLDDLVVELLEKRPEDRPGAYQIVQRLEEGIGHRLEPPGLGSVTRAVSSGTKKVLAPREGTGAPLAVVAIIAITLAVLASVMAVLLVGIVLFTLTLPSDAELASAPAVESGPTPVPPAPGPAPDPVPSAPKPVPVAPSPVPDTPIPAPEVQEADFTEPARRAEVKVTCNRRALVLIDGTPKGMAPVVEPVLPGVHRVAVMLPGKPDSRQEKKVSVKQGEQSWLVFAF